MISESGILLLYKHFITVLMHTTKVMAHNTYRVPTSYERLCKRYTPIEHTCKATLERRRIFGR